MKKIILMIVLCAAMLIPAMAIADDMVITITIPDAYADRLKTAVRASVNCDKTITTPTETPILDEFGEPTGETEMVDVITVKTMAPKACLARQFKQDIKQIVRTYERQIAEKEAQAAYSQFYKAWKNSYQAITVE